MESTDRGVNETSETIAETMLNNRYILEEEFDDDDFDLSFLN